MKAERGNLPSSYVYNYRGRRMEFSVSQSFFPPPSSLSLSLFPLSLQSSVDDSAALVMTVMHFMLCVPHWMRLCSLLF